MTWRVVREPEQLLGLGGLPTWIAERGIRSLAVWTDPRASISSEVRDVLSRRDVALTTVRSAPAGSSPLDQLDLALDAPRPDAVLAVGGGSVLDLAKLHAACLTSPSTRARLAVVERCGWLPLAPDGRSRVPLIAIPTTIGTGSEVSRFACIDGPDGKRLVQGDPLLPALAVGDPAATRGLTHRQVIDAVVEILARVVGPYTGTTASGPVQDRTSEAVVARLVSLGNALAEAEARGEADPDESIRTELSRLSVLTHAPWLNEGRDPFGNRTWFLVTELADVTGCGKARAVGALLPLMWELAGGATVWSDPFRVSMLWSAARTEDLGLPETPAAGLRTVLQRWGVEPVTGSTDLAEELGRHAHRRWGGGLPMLAGVTRRDLVDLYRRCLVQARPTDDPAAIAAGADVGFADPNLTTTCTEGRNA